MFHIFYFFNIFYILTINFDLPIIIIDTKIKKLTFGLHLI
jgi:hypothetical protein